MCTIRARLYVCVLLSIFANAALRRALAFPYGPPSSAVFFILGMKLSGNGIETAA